MTKRIIAALFAAFMLFIAACKPAEVSPQPPIDNTTPDAPDTQIQPQQDDSDPYLADDLAQFMKQRYQLAREAAGWFAIETMPTEQTVTDENQMKEVNGKKYYKVEHETIKTVSDLENHLKSLFSDEMADGIIQSAPDLYIDIDGELWTQSAARGTNITVGNTIFSVTESTDDRIVYTANVEEVNPVNDEVVGINQYDFIYSKTDNGWRWTQFYIYE